MCLYEGTKKKKTRSIREFARKNRTDHAYEQVVARIGTRLSSRATIGDVELAAQSWNCSFLLFPQSTSFQTSFLWINRYIELPCLSTKIVLATLNASWVRASESQRRRIDDKRTGGVESTAAETINGFFSDSHDPIFSECGERERRSANAILSHGRPPPGGELACVCENRPYQIESGEASDWRHVVPINFIGTVSFRGPLPRSNVTRRLKATRT